MPDQFGNINFDDLKDLGGVQLTQEELADVMARQRRSDENRRIGDPGGNIIANAILQKRDATRKAQHRFSRFSGRLLDIMRGLDPQGAQELVEEIAQDNFAVAGTVAQQFANLINQREELDRKLEKERADAEARRAAALGLRPGEAAPGTAEAALETLSQIPRDPETGERQTTGTGTEIKLRGSQTVPEASEELLDAKTKLLQQATDELANEATRRKATSEIEELERADLARQIVILGTKTGKDFDAARTAMLNALKLPSSLSNTVSIDPIVKMSVISTLENAAGQNRLTDKQTAQIASALGETDLLEQFHKMEIEKEKTRREELTANPMMDFFRLRFGDQQPTQQQPAEVQDADPTSIDSIAGALNIPR